MSSLSSISVEDAPKTKPFSEILGPLRLLVFGTAWMFFVETKGQPLGKQNPSRKCQEIWESIPQQTTRRRNY